MRRMADDVLGPQDIHAKIVSISSVSAANHMNVGERIRKHRLPFQIQRERHPVCLSLGVGMRLIVLLS